MAFPDSSSVLDKFQSAITFSFLIREDFCALALSLSLSQQSQCFYSLQQCADNTAIAKKIKRKQPEILTN